MIIKFSDKFESILFAVMYGNLTGYCLIAKTQPDNLFVKDDYCDIDKINWQEIMQTHNEKFGPIGWLNHNNKDYINFKNDLELALRYWKPIKYLKIISSINLAFKMGIKYLYANQIEEFNSVLAYVAQVKKEVASSWGQINFTPTNINNEKFLFARAEIENFIGDMLINELKKKYLSYNIILKTSKAIYVYYQENFYQFPLNCFKLEFDSKTFFDFWQAFKNQILQLRTFNL
jgi:hypothetical protein